MDSFVQLLMLAINLVVLTIILMMAINLSRIVSVSKNSEKILQRILELIKESSNEAKRKQSF